MDKQKEISCLAVMADGDREAFNMLFLHYYPKLKLFISGLAKNNIDSEDIAQEVFLKIWNNRAEAAKINNFSAYIYSLGKNALYNYFEHNLVKEKYIKHISELEYDEYLAFDDIYADQLAELINLTVMTMPKQRCEIFLMSRKEHLSNQEIADKLGISKRTVENHLTNALAQLRQVILSFKILLF